MTKRRTHVSLNIPVDMFHCSFLLVFFLAATVAWQVDVGFSAGHPLGGTGTQWEALVFFPANMTIVEGDNVTFILRDAGTGPFL